MKLLRRFDVRLTLYSMLFLLLALMCVTTLIISQYQSALMAQNEQQTMSIFEQSEIKIDRLLQSARESASLLCKNNAVTSYLYQRFDKEAERIVALREMLRSITETLNYGNTLNGVWFLHGDGTMVGATENWHFVFEHTPYPLFEGIQLDELAQWNSVTWIGGWWLEELTQYPKKSTATQGKVPGDVMILGVISNRYRLLGSDELQPLYTLLSIGEEALRECLEPLSTEGGEVYLLDANGRQLLGPVLEDLKVEPWFWLEIDRSQATGSRTLTHAGSNYQMIYRSLENTGWMLVKTIPFEIYSKQIHQLRIMTWGIGLGIVVLALVLYGCWVMKFSRPFQEMSAALEQVRRGNLSIQMPHAYTVYEFELMRGEFNSMIQSIQRLLAQTKAMERQRVELELRNLQSQLNPHMVFNSITAIRWMAMMSGADKVDSMLVELAELMRPIFTEWRLVWTLQAEISYVEHYMKLLSLRFGGLVSSDMYLEEGLMKTTLPCFTLQPLLENCAEHGIKDGKALHILVEGVCLNDERIRLRVSDNGRGMNAAKLEAIRQKMNAQMVLPEDGVGHSGIGLINVYRRLKMFGGGACEMIIESLEGQGTTITLWLPVKIETEKS